MCMSCECYKVLQSPVAIANCYYRDNNRHKRVVLSGGSLTGNAAILCEVRAKRKFGNDVTALRVTVQLSSNFVCLSQRNRGTSVNKN